MPFVDRNASESYQLLSERNIHFVGRQNELHYFIEHVLRSEKPPHNIISVYGQAGVGKSTLLSRFLDEVSTRAFKSYCKIALVDEHEASPTSVMEKFAQQLHLTNAFEKVLGSYKDALRKLRNEQVVARDDALRKVAHTTSAAIKEIPVPFISSLAGKGTEIIADYALEKIHAHQLLQEARQLADPLKDLTSAFVEELNTLADSPATLSGGRAKRRHRIVLLFDTFEQLALEIAPWLLDYFLESEISADVVLVVAGRYPLDRSTPHDPKRWLPYLETVVYPMRIESFTQDETQKYLQEKGVTDLAQISTIWELSQGLPLYLGLLTSGTEGMVDPTADVVANFLRWIPEQDSSKRKLVLDAALFSRPFNQDELAAFPYITEQDRPLLYHWLTTQPFIHTNHLDGRHSYHELAQELFQRHLLQRAPSDYHKTRKLLSVYYQGLLEEIEREEGMDSIATPDWLELKLALATQLFLCKEKICHVRAIEQIVEASVYAAGRGEVNGYLRKFAEKQPKHSVPRVAHEIVKDLLCCIEAAEASQEVLRAINHLLEEVRSYPSGTTSLQAKLLVMRAEAYKHLDELEKALEDCSQALTLDDADAHMYCVRGSIYDELGDWQSALVDISRAIELVPDEVYYYEQRASVYAELREWQPALVDYTRAIELTPDVLFNYLLRAAIYRDLGRWQQALADCEQAIQLAPNEAVCYLHRAEVRYRQKEWQAAVDDYTRTIDLSPNEEPAQMATYYGKRAFAGTALQEWQCAFDDATRAIELSPDEAFYYDLRAEVCFMQEEWQQAVADYTRAIELLPDDAIYYRKRAEVQGKLGKRQQALADYSRAIELYPEAALYYVLRAEIHCELQEWQQAVSDYTEALELAPDVADYYFERGEIFCKQGEWQAALADYTQAIALDPGEVFYYVGRAELFCEQEDWQAALADYAQAIALDPDVDVLYLHRAAVWQNLGELEQAQIDCQIFQERVKKSFFKANN